MSGGERPAPKGAFEIVFEGHGRSSGKMRNDITVAWPGMGERFDLATDEGPFHGGDGTAPPPLALFTAALTGCLMTQIRAFAKRLRIDLKGVEVKARLHWSGETTPEGCYESAPVGFTLDVDIDADASPEEKLRLLDRAKKGCFIEATLARPNAVAHRLRIGDEYVEA